MSTLTCCVCGASVLVDDTSAGPCVPVNWTVTFRQGGFPYGIPLGPIYYCPDPACWRHTPFAQQANALPPEEKP